MTPTGRFPLTTTMRVIHRVHSHTTNMGATTFTAIPASFA
jgi:hypothetical protein